MDGIQQSFANMCAVTETAVDTSDPVIIAGIQNFPGAYAAFKVSKAAIDDLFDQQQLDRSGNEINKVNARAALVDLTMDLSAKAVSYAGAVNDNVLLNTINYSKAILDKQSNYEFVASCTIMSETLTPLLAALLPYGVTAAIMAGYNAQRAAFDVLSPLPISGRNDKTLITAAIKDEITVAKGHLVVMDRAMRTVRLSHAGLYKRYFISRAVIEPAARVMAGRGRIVGPDGEALPFVRVSCKALGIDRRSSAKGLFQVQNAGDGTYSFIFTYAGYETVTVNVSFNLGVRAEILVKMSFLVMSL